MSDQDQPKQDQLKDSQYDGIQEYDNDLPKWWLGTFFITIIFAFIYWSHYFILGSGPTQEQEYKDLMAEHDKAYQKAAPAPGSELTDDALLAMLKKSDVVSAGKGVFQQNCIPCHGQAGEGTIGPNLTDDYWIHGGKPINLYNTVTTGVPEKGMISWKTVLKEDQIKSVVAYVMTLKGTNPPNGKAPQGNKE